MWLRGLAATLLFPGFAFCDTPSSEKQYKTIVHVGDTAVQLVSTEKRPILMTFVSIHENEQTAVAACRRLIGHFGGRLIELKAQAKRLVTFTLNGGGYTFDPNRIFTDVGIEKSLRRYGTYSKPARAAVAQLRETLLNVIRKNLRPPVIALHNNSNGAFSIDSYKPGAPLRDEASRIATNQKLDPDDFFLVTEADLYDRLRTGGFNVVLQSPRPTDDGSMSEYCQQNRLPYVNVEAEFGHLAEQYKMLEFLQNFASYSSKRGS